MWPRMHALTGAWISGRTWAKVIPRNTSGRYAEMSCFAWHFRVASLAKGLGQDLKTVSCLSTVSLYCQRSMPKDKQEHGAINHIQYIVINRVTIIRKKRSYRFRTALLPWQYSYRYRDINRFLMSIVLTWPQLTGNVFVTLIECFLIVTKWVTFLERCHNIEP